jgi:hypothetical protein
VIDEAGPPQLLALAGFCLFFTSITGDDVILRLRNRFTNGVPHLINIIKKNMSPRTDSYLVDHLSI